MNVRLTREKVIARAAALIDDIGFHELTITKLGRFLQIAPPGVYRHVTDLHDLKQAISRLAYREAAMELSEACAGLSGIEALTALAVTLRKWAHNHPGRYTALQIAPDTDDANGQIAAEPILKVITATLRAYSFDDEDLTDAIRIVRSTLHGFISLELDEGFKDNRSLDATFDRLIHSLDTTFKEWKV